MPIVPNQSVADLVNGNAVIIRQGSENENASRNLQHVIVSFPKAFFAQGHPATCIGISSDSDVMQMSCDQKANIYQLDKEESKFIMNTAEFAKLNELNYVV